MTRGCNDCTLAPGRPPFLTSFRWTKCAPPTAVRFDSPDDRTGRKGRAAGLRVPGGFAVNAHLVARQATDRPRWLAFR